MADLDLSGPSIDIEGDFASVKTITVGLDFDGSGSTWSALVRRHPTRGEFVEWTVDDTDAGTTGTITVDGEDVAVEGALDISADFTVLSGGVWYWTLFRDGETFFGLGKVTVNSVVEGPPA